MKYIVRKRYLTDQYEVVRSYGFRENLIAVLDSRVGAEQVAAEYRLLSKSGSKIQPIQKKAA